MSEVLIINREKIITDKKVIIVNENVNDELIASSFQNAAKKLSPLWDIRDYVAVNPFFGLREENFLNAAKYFRLVSGKGIMPRKKFFRKKFMNGEITEYDLEISLKLVREEIKSPIGEIEIKDLISYIKSPESLENDFNVKCISDIFDVENKTQVTSLITNEISRWASSYFDEGQATWKIPVNGQRFYSWWKSLAKYDCSIIEMNSIFTNLVNSLPCDPNEALKFLSQKISDKKVLSAKELTDYYYRIIYSVLGWASYLQKFEFEALRSGDQSKLKDIGGLIDIVVIRLTYDVALLSTTSNLHQLSSEQAYIDNSDIDLNYVWLNAAENAYRRSIETTLKKRNESSDSSVVRDVQLVFCIDVRSELIRRHLEKLSPQIETIGFAGFFGMPISIKGLGHSHVDQNCPVLLNPVFQIEQNAIDKNEALKTKKNNFVEGEYFKKTIQTSANSCFSFVETLGLGYISKILMSGLGRKKTNLDISSLGLSNEDKKFVSLDASELDFDSKVSLSLGALTNMGLNKNFSKFIFFFGHASQSANNPYSSALDCGACAGHSGEVNAKFITSLLNEREIRKELKGRGIDIPEGTVFLSGWHNTTLDELVVNGTRNLNFEQLEELKKIDAIFKEASRNCAQERAQKLPLCSNLHDKELSRELIKKGNDWSEIRPEWGLARNASFIIGRRELTRNIDLDGRSFLHNYDYSEDHDLAKLELIMTAPMIVTNWINMQYYASTVFPEKFGAGNKVLNNVVGNIGCILGNESDLLGGLTEQSVFYKGEYFHEPIRLQVFIEAHPDSINKIIEKHKLVRDLISNNWLKVVSINPDNKELLLYHSNEWIPNSGTY